MKFKKEVMGALHFIEVLHSPRITSDRQEKPLFLPILPESHSLSVCFHLALLHI